MTIQKIIITSLIFRNYRRNGLMLKKIYNMPNVETGTVNFLDCTWKAQLIKLSNCISSFDTYYFTLSLLSNLGIPNLYTWRILNITLNKMYSREGKGQLSEHVMMHVSNFLCIISMYVWILL